MNSEARGDGGISSEEGKALVLPWSGLSRGQMRPICGEDLMEERSNRLEKVSSRKVGIKNSSARPSHLPRRFCSR